MMTGRRWLWSGMLVLVAGTAPVARAQRDSARVAPKGAIYLRVADTAGAPVAGAEIVLPVLGVSLKMPPGGAMVLKDVRSGTYVVQARRLGYAAETRLVHVGTDTAHAEFRLVSATVLDTVNVRARGGGSMADFERRRRGSGFGHFITAADIERRQPPRLSSMLLGIPGVKVIPVGGLSFMVKGGRPPVSCPMEVYVDGVLVSESGNAGVAPNAALSLLPKAYTPTQIMSATGGNSTTGQSGQENGGAGTGGNSAGTHTSGSDGTAQPVGGTSNGAGITPGKPLPLGLRNTAGTGFVGPSAPPPPPASFFDIDALPTSAIAGIEVYSDANSIPPQYQPLGGSICGVILIWTK